LIRALKDHQARQDQLVHQDQRGLLGQQDLKDHLESQEDHQDQKDLQVLKVYKEKQGHQDQKDL
jgi:hypothetical protein